MSALQSTTARAELAMLDQWVVSKLVENRNPKTGAITFNKPPMRRDGKRLRVCSATEAANWTSHDDAQATVEQGIDGAQAVGFCFHDADPFTGIDLDGCRNPETGAIEEWAQVWIDRLNSYTEISVSGTGVKVIVRGKLNGAISLSLGVHKGIEVYSRQRFFWMTFNQLPGTSDSIRDAQGVLDQMADELAPAPKATPVRKVSPGELAVERMDGESPIDRLHRELDLDEILERNGYVLVAERGDLHDFCAPASENHTHRITITTSPATKHVGRIGYSHSPNGALGNATYPNGFDALNALEALEGKTLRDLMPRRASRPSIERQVPEYLTQAGARRRAADRERKHATRRAEAAEIRADVEARAAGDERLTPADRATLSAMLAWAAERNSDCCWCGRATLAEQAGYSLGAVKRSVMRLESLGYFESTGRGGKPTDTAKRTFTCGSFEQTRTRGSSFSNETISILQDDPRIDHVHDSYSNTCEGGATSSVVPTAWELFEPVPNDGHGADELNALDMPPPHQPMLALKLDATPVVEPVTKPSVERSGSLWCVFDRERWTWHTTEQDAQLAAGLAEESEPVVGGASYNPEHDWTAGGTPALADEPYAVPDWLRIPGDLALVCLSDEEVAAVPEQVSLPIGSEPEPLVRCPPIEPDQARAYYRLQGARRKARSSAQRAVLDRRMAALERWVPVGEALAESRIAGGMRK